MKKDSVEKKLNILEIGKLRNNNNLIYTKLCEIDDFEEIFDFLNEENLSETEEIKPQKILKLDDYLLFLIYQHTPALKVAFLYRNNDLAEKVNNITNIFHKKNISEGIKKYMDLYSHEIESLIKNIESDDRKEMDLNLSVTLTKAIFDNYQNYQTKDFSQKFDHDEMKFLQKLYENNPIIKFYLNTYFIEKEKIEHHLINQETLRQIEIFENSYKEPVKRHITYRDVFLNEKSYYNKRVIMDILDYANQIEMAFKQENTLNEEKDIRPNKLIKLTNERILANKNLIKKIIESETETKRKPETFYIKDNVLGIPYSMERLKSKIPSLKNQSPKETVKRSRRIFQKIWEQFLDHDLHFQDVPPGILSEFNGFLLIVDRRITEGQYLKIPESNFKIIEDCFEKVDERNFLANFIYFIQELITKKQYYFKDKFRSFLKYIKYYNSKTKTQEGKKNLIKIIAKFLENYNKNPEIFYIKTKIINQDIEIKIIFKEITD